MCSPHSGQMAHPLCSFKLRMDPTPAWPAFCEACVPNLDPTLDLSGNKTTRVPTSPSPLSRHLPLRATASCTCSRAQCHLLKGLMA